MLRGEESEDGDIIEEEKSNSEVEPNSKTTTTTVPEEETHVTVEGVYESLDDELFLEEETSTVVIDKETEQPVSDNLEMEQQTPDTPHMTPLDSPSVSLFSCYSYILTPAHVRDWSGSFDPLFNFFFSPDSLS